MRGVGPGTVLGGRYTVHRRLEQLHGTERWSADDTTLGRSVSVLCASSDDHRTAALLDAARRAAGVTHVVFVRILDVGTDALTVMCAGTPDQLDAMEELIRPFGITDLQRTGRIALPRIPRGTVRLAAVPQTA